MINYLIKNNYGDFEAEESEKWRREVIESWDCVNIDNGEKSD